MASAKSPRAMRPLAAPLSTYSMPAPLYDTDDMVDRSSGTLSTAPTSVQVTAVPPLTSPSMRW